jgi:hypothetical protein
MTFEKRGLTRHDIRMVYVIGMIDGDVFTASASNAVIHVSELAAILRLAVIDNAIAVGAGNPGGAIGGGIVHQQDFLCRIALGNDGIEARAQKALRVVRRYDNGDERQCVRSTGPALRFAYRHRRGLNAHSRVFSHHLAEKIQKRRLTEALKRAGTDEPARILFILVNLARAQ